MNELACLGWLTQHDELDLQSASSTDHQLWRVWRVASAERETKNFLRALEGENLNTLGQSLSLSTQTPTSTRGGWCGEERERERKLVVGVGNEMERKQKEISCCCIFFSTVCLLVLSDRSNRSFACWFSSLRHFKRSRRTSAFLWKFFSAVSC